MLTQTLAFIGGGNMARSLIGGLIAQGVTAANITVADPMQATLQSLQATYSVNVTTSNSIAVQHAQVVVLAIKPQELRGAAENLRSSVTHQPLIISVAAGIRASDIERWLGLPVVRTMPNRPALNGCGVTGLYANTKVTAAQRELAATLMNAVGTTVWVNEESQIDAVTAVSGSGPAYFFLLMELLEAAGIEQGLPADVARTLAIETAYGAGRMAREVIESPATLREQVTSKGGTTAAALQVFSDRQLKSIVSDAVNAAAKRSAELAEMLGRAQ